MLKLDTVDQTLHFNLERNAAPRVVMKMSNTSSSRVLFKVRTTQPLWYYVRPNQDILEAGQDVDLVFTLTEPESKRLLEQQKEGKEDSVEKHRFMVQGVALEQSDFDIISAMPADNRVAEYTRIWETGGKEDKSAMRLKVQFHYPDKSKSASTAASSSSSGGAVGEDQDEGSRFSAPRGATSPTNAGVDDAGGMTENSSYEACWAELQELKKKYDQVREYTVHLTAERDTVLSKLERLQKEMKLEGEGDRAKDKTTSRFALKETARGIAVSDYSLFMVLFAAVVAFLAGYFVST